MRRNRSFQQVNPWIGMVFLALSCAVPGGAQELDERCMASALNRSIQVNPDGGFALGNVPVPLGAFRVRVTCDGEVVDTGRSGFLFGVGDGVTRVEGITFGADDPIPESLEITSTVNELRPPITGTQLVSTGILQDGTPIDLTLADSGTFYLSSNPAIATVSADGFVNAVSSGRVLMTATHVGVIATFALLVILDDDADGDGLPDDFELTNALAPDGGPGLDPADPGDAAADFDQDGLSNLEEFELGTSLFLADTDSDGLLDAEEGPLGSSPLLADSDADGLLDGAEPNPTGDNDGDGVVNILDADSDNDGLLDGIEVRLGLDPLRGDTDNDRVLDAAEDSDGDGLTNGAEVLIFTDPGNPDSDGDSLDDFQEANAGRDGFVTDPLRADSDGDGMGDSFESFFGLDPTDAADAGLDSDGDGSSNLAEAQSGGDPTGTAVRVASPLDGSDVFEGEPFTLVLDATDRVAGVTVEYLIDGAVVASDAELPFELLVDPPPGVLELTLGARAFDTAGNTAVAADVMVFVRGEPATTAAGVVVDDAGNPIAGLTVSAPPDLSTTTDASGAFSLPGVSAVIGPIFMTIEGTFDGVRTVRRTEALEPVIGFITDFGEITFVERLAVALFPGQKFLTARDVLGSGITTDLAVADFNGDGFEDVAAGTSGGVSILLGYGDGGLQDELFIPENRRPETLTVADMNSDGIPDLVAVTFSVSRRVIIFLGRGDGTFEDRHRATISGFLPLGVETVDMNGDGHLDVAVTNRDSHDVSVFLGDGEGSLGLEQRFSACCNPEELASGDFTGDGVPDLAVIDRSRVLLLRGLGNGTFASPTSISLGFGLRPRSVVAADLDRDGDLDLAVTNTSSNFTSPAANGLSILLGRGNGTFSPAVGLMPQESLGSLHIEDFDDDGALDIVFGSSRSVGVLFGAGNGTFPRLERMETGNIPRELTLADLDRDGRRDVVMTTGDISGYGVVVFRGVDGTLGNGGIRVLSLDDPNQEGFVVSVVTADFNGDGHLDVVSAVSGPVGGAMVALGRGDGSYATAQRLVSTGIEVEAAAAGDFNNDGHPDVAVANSRSDDVSIFLGLGDGTFGGEQRFAAGDNPQDVDVGDFDNDGHLDLVTAAATSSSSSGRATVLPGNGDGTFGTPRGFTAGRFPLDVAVADLDLDGNLDILVADISTSRNDGGMVLYGNGNGFFQFRRTLSSGRTGGVAVGDVNADGIPDVVFGPSGSGVGTGFLRLLIGRGNRLFEPQLNVGNQAGRHMTIGDVNLDGFGDLVTGLGSGNSSLLVHVSRGNGTFHPELRFVGGGQNNGKVTVADVNDDGANDVLLADGFRNQERIGVLLNRFPDRDGDGLSDADEARLGTDPDNPDSDGDGLLDGFEAAAGLDAAGNDDSAGDGDGDGLVNLGEQAAGTDPTDPDSDGDGLLDGFEVVNGFDPRRPGEELADGDGDGLDNLGEQAAGTDPGNPDSDGDGLRDGFEVANGFDPVGRNDGADDPDADGLDNLGEQSAATDPRDSDSDDDALTDGEEVLSVGTDPLRADTDNDGLADGEEVRDFGTDPLRADSDGDGLGDGVEVTVHGTDPLLADSDGGGASDGQEVLLDGSDPLDPSDDGPPVTVTALPVDLIDGLGFLWDIQPDGQIATGTDNAFGFNEGGGDARSGAEKGFFGPDGGAALSLREPVFADFPHIGQAVVLQGGRELAIGPYSEPLFGGGELTVRRRIFAAPDDGFIRYLEIFEHSESAPVLVEMTLESRMGSDFFTDVVATSSGDFSATPADDYFVTDDFGDFFGVPAVAHVFSGPVSGEGGSVVEPLSVQAFVEFPIIGYTFEFVVPVGERVILMHFLAQRTAPEDAEAVAAALVLTPAGALVGMSAEELDAVLNFDLGGGGVLPLSTPEVSE